MVNHGCNLEKIKKNSVSLYAFTFVIYYQKHSEKIERNLKERKFGLAKNTFFKKEKTNVACIPCRTYFCIFVPH